MATAMRMVQVCNHFSINIINIIYEVTYDSSIVEEAEQMPQLWLEFKVFLKNAADDTHSQESRKLKFWFKVR